MFHRITAEGEKYFIPPMAVSYKTFSSLMMQVLKFRKIVRLEDAVKAIREKNLKGKTLAVTFDDGYRDNYALASPFLKTKGIPATFFIPVRQIDSGKPYWWDYLNSVLRNHRTAFQKWLDNSGYGNIPGNSGDMSPARLMVRRLNAFTDEKRNGFLTALCNEFGKSGDESMLMNWDEIRQLQADGFSIGSHTLSHIPLTDLSIDEAENEIVSSREMIGKRAGKIPEGFSYPRGAWNDELARIAEKAGYSYAVTTEFKSNRKGSHLYALSRRNMEDYQGIRSLFSIPMHLLEISGIADKILSKRRG